MLISVINCVYLGDIDIFLGPSVLKRIREMKRINKELDGLDFGRLRLIPPRREDYAQEKVLSVHNIDYDGIRTKVQVGLIKDTLENIYNSHFACSSSEERKQYKGVV